MPEQNSALPTDAIKSILNIKYKMKDFVKKNYEIFVVNFILFGFISIITLAQFGVHIKVDKGVDLVPIEIGYSQSTVRISSKFVDVYDGYVRLEYENDAKKSFWVPASVVFGRASEYDIKDMIQAGDSIKRNVFIKAKSGKVIGVTKSGKSILSLYYCNSKLFRYGIWILIMVDIFVGLVIKFTKKEIDMSRYRYYPEDKRKLELNEILFKMRNLRVLYILSIPVWAVWGSFAFALFAVCSTEAAIATVWIVGIIIILSIIPLGLIILFRYRAKNKDEKNRIIENANIYLSNVGDDFLEKLQADLNKGLPFVKKHNLIISEKYIIGSIKDTVLDPIAIPKEQVREIAYVYYEIVTLKHHMTVQEVYFRLKNGKEIRMPVNDIPNLGLTLRALEDCGVPIIDITHEKRT